MGWIYAGHGEWFSTETEKQGAQLPRQQPSEEGIMTEPYWIKQWFEKNDPDTQNNVEVRRHGYPNRWGARREVKSRWNLEAFKKLLGNYWDKEMVDWLQFGWPAGRLPTLPSPELSKKNHKGATDYPDQLKKYITKEQEYGAVMGPYTKIPFTHNIGISPLSSRPKKGSDERRVILDLSFPIGKAVNDEIPKDNYLKFAAKLSFPRTDDFALRIFQLGKGCYMFKVDLSRYFRQIPLDLGDYSLIGYVIKGQIFFDKVLPMGLRSAPYIAQRLTNAIAYIHRQMEWFLLNYVYDFVGAEIKDKIWESFNALTSLLETLKVETSKDKMVPPTTRLEFLGITFDSDTMTMEISQTKLEEIKQEVSSWLLRTTACRREIESLIGKLQFVAKCIKAGRIFLGRLINWIRGMERNQQYPIPIEARKDIAWWGRCIQEDNGVSLMWLLKEPDTDTIIQTDVYPKGYGGICGSEYFRGRFQKQLQNHNIAILEMWAVMVVLKLGAHKLWEILLDSC